MEHTCIKLNDTAENAMDSENGISRPTESSLYLLLSQCLSLSFYVCVKGRKRWQKQTSHKCSKKLKKKPTL